MNNLAAIAQIAAAIATVGLAVLTFFYVLSTRQIAKRNEEAVEEMRQSRNAQDRANREMLEENRRMVEEMRVGREAQDRPLVVIDVDYSRIPMLSLVIRNIGKGAARKVKFVFLSPLVVPEEAFADGEGEIVLSSLPVFSKGIDFLAPGAEIPITWGGFTFIANDLYRRGLDRRGIRLHIKYKSLDGREYIEENWQINPVDMEEIARRPQYTEEDMIAAVTRAAEKIDKAMDLRNRLKILTATEERQESDERWKELTGKSFEDWKQEQDKRGQQTEEGPP